MHPICFNSVELFCTAYMPDQFVRDSLPQIVFVGRSNVGKSSLINKLMGRKNLARTSSKPGKTLSINYFKVEKLFYFVDLPGYGYANAPKTEIKRANELLESYFHDNKSLKVICLLIDSRRGFTDKDLVILEKIIHIPTTILTIATKVDKISFSDLKRLVTNHQKEFDISLVPFTINKEIHRENLLKVLFKLIEVDHVFIKRFKGYEAG